MDTKLKPETAILPEKTKPKLCIDCKHHSAGVIHTCDAERLVDLVDGTPISRECYKSRTLSNLCGEEARWFESK